MEAEGLRYSCFLHTNTHTHTAAAAAALFKSKDEKMAFLEAFIFSPCFLSLLAHLQQLCPLAREACCSDLGLPPRRPWVLMFTSMGSCQSGAMSVLHTYIPGACCQQKVKVPEWLHQR